MTQHNSTCEPSPFFQALGPGEDTLRALGWLSLGIAHDFNNLLTVIMSAADMASDKSVPGTLHELETIELACLQGRELVNTVTEFCRKESTCATLVDLNRMASKIIRFLPQGIGKVGVLLDLSPDQVLVMAVKPDLNSALLNILFNSLDAMPRGGRLVLRTRIEGSDKVSLTIQDTGEGMSAASLARATEPFYTTKPVGKGCGLGLARVRQTVEAHQGALAISSEEGLGTTVRIEFPRAVPTSGDDSAFGGV